LRSASGFARISSIEVLATQKRPLRPAASNVPLLPMKYGAMVFPVQMGM